MWKDTKLILIFVALAVICGVDQTKAQEVCGDVTCAENQECNAETTCACMTGFAKAEANTCVDIDECTTGAAGCHKNAECANNDGSYDCTCNTGYTGDGIDCASFDKTTAQEDCGGETCEENEECDDTTTCVCTSGFEADDAGTCVDVNECTAVTDNCHDNATCTNNEGSFTCACNAGFNGDGLVCDEDDVTTVSGDGEEPTTAATDENEQQALSEQADEQALATSNPEDITPTVVGNTQPFFDDVSQTTEVIPPETADNTVAITSNLLQSSGSALQQVILIFQIIFQALQNVAQNVQLNNNRGNGVNTFENEGAFLGICIIASGSFARASTGSQSFYYGPDSNFQDPCNIQASTMTLRTSEPSHSSYVAATPTQAGKRINFQAYCGEAFGAATLEGQSVEPVIFSADGEGLNNFTIKFKLNDAKKDLTLTTDQKNCYGETDSNDEKTYKALRAKIYNSTTNTWRSATDSDCDPNSYCADNGFAKVTCSTAGMYTLVEETLSECGACNLGAIFAIIISCVASVHLLMP